MGLAVDVGKLSLVAKPIFTVEMTTPAMTKKGLLNFGIWIFYVHKSFCLNDTEYEFYMISNLVKDVGKRIQSLRENVKELVEAKCPTLTCPDSSCDDDWVSYNGSCSLFEATQTRNFEDARIFCKQKASVILYVQDEAENSFIVRTLSYFFSIEK
ncbi:uncharacterized protein LOC132745217 [Ruditapes philippinarum]|uniref:uncharacterized protein LOC132745217 n=1 Tax=Ruditapes philippinarum TaxID=129788 RepID=UPI00295C2445|nr:uncharacterized protein LOC132745217 [Ruditapes philippinarum]